MSRFIHKKLLTGILFSVVFAAGLLLATPGRVFADCPHGQVPVTGGGCCPSAQVVFATNGSVSCGGGSTPCPGAAAVNCLLATYVNPLIALLSAAVGVVVVITIIRGGIEYVTSGGDPQKAAAGKTHITNALIGLAAYLTIYAFLQFIIPGGLL